GTMTFPHNLLLRSAAQTGDAIAVTGWLGASAAGLRLLQAGAAPAASTVLLDVHRRPTPRLEAGRLALEAGVRCGMDVSDGLVGDLEKLCRASGLAAAIDLPSVPVAPEARAAFPQDWQRLALAGGEDYELLLVAPAEVLDAVAERSALPVTVVGRTLPGPPGQVTVRDAEGRPVPTGAGGWDHLARR
ncbi:MAG: thiamine-phosphate kinase, partial [Chloroflexi bacterium]|nr:thiamine-phosphate kinase [Chloroflexota bacterium]